MVGVISELNHEDFKGELIDVWPRLNFVSYVVNVRCSVYLRCVSHGGIWRKVVLYMILG